MSPYDFHIFSQSINIFFCSFCTYSIEILKVAEKCKIIKIKAPREVWGLGINKKLAGGQDFPNY